MNQAPVGGRDYSCPMHSNIRQTAPGKCPVCHMDLLPEGTRFGMLRHMVRNPVMLAVMAAVMLAIMAMIMM